MNKATAWIIGGVAAAGAIGGGAYYWWQQNQPAPAPVPPPVAEAPPAPPAKAEPTEPAIRHPIEQAQGEAKEPAKETRPLPVLSQSDATIQQAISELIGQKQLLDYFYVEEMIRRIVATVDNLPRDKIGQRVMVFKPVRGAFTATGSDERSEITPQNAARYAPYIKLFESVDAKKWVGAYVRLYPLFQQAYQDLGYPKGYFNDRLVQVIDHLLAAPEVPGPIALVRPKVMYLYADESLEARSAGHKALIRMGPENAARVKAKLREIRGVIVGEGPVK